MKRYIAFNTTNANWWDGKTFHAENPPLLITAPELAVLRATYDNVVGTEVVTVPTVTEEESWENQEIDLDGGASAVNEDGTLEPYATFDAQPGGSDDPWDEATFDDDED